MHSEDAKILAREAVAKIDRRKADLDYVREILGSASPDQIALLREYLVGDTNGRAARAPVQIIKRNVSLMGRSGRGTLIEAVQRVIVHQDTITSTAVLSDLQKEGFRFANENPIAAVSAVLSKLHKRGKLVMVRKGKGAIPTEFRKAGTHTQRAKATA
jgi:hypothetical protein